MSQATLQFPLNLTIDQTETGYRVVLNTTPPETVEAPTLTQLLRRLAEKVAEIEEEVYDLETAKRAMESIAVNGSVPWNQVKAELGLRA